MAIKGGVRPATEVPEDEVPSAAGTGVYQARLKGKGPDVAWNACCRHGSCRGRASGHMEMDTIHGL
jgi:hypothetical protein